MSNSKLLAGLCCGIALILVSLLHGGASGDRHKLSVKKAKEIQQARREFHSLSHELAQHVAGNSPKRDEDGNPQAFDKTKLLAAEKNFNRLQAEVDAIRNSRPWLTTLLRVGGIGICLLVGILAFVYRRETTEPQLDQASASAISAYESSVRHHT